MQHSARRSREELRIVLLDVGVALLLERGLVGGAEHVTFAEVFAAAEGRWGSSINPASVYKRIWGTQAEFQRDLVLAAAAFYPDGEEQPTLAAARTVLASADLSTAQSRKAALSELCRVAGEVHVRILERSRPWQIWVGIWALTVSTPSTVDDEILGPAIRVGHEKAARALQVILEEVIPAIGYRMAPSFSFEQLSLAIEALTEGMALRGRFADARVLNILRPDVVSGNLENSRSTSPAGALEASATWTLFAVAMESLVLQFCEPDLKFRPKRQEMSTS